MRACRGRAASPALSEDVSQVSLRDATVLRFAGGLFSVALSVNGSTGFSLCTLRLCSQNFTLPKRHRLKSVLLLPWRYQARCPVKSSVDRSPLTINSVRVAVAIRMNAERSTCLRTVSGLSSRPGCVAAALRRHSSAGTSDHPARPPLPLYLR